MTNPRKNRFLYTRHLDSPLTLSKLKFYKSYPACWDKRYPGFSHQYIDIFSNGFSNGTNVFPWLLTHVKTSSISLISNWSSRWDLVKRVTSKSLTVQLAAMYSDFPGLNPNSFSTLIDQSLSSSDLLSAFINKGIVLQIHQDLLQISQINTYPATLPSLPSIQVHSDMVLLTEFPSRPLIIPYNFFLGVLDRLESELAYKVYINLTVNATDKGKFSFDTLSNTIDNQLDNIYKSLGNEAIRVFKLMEPITIGVCLKLLPEESNNSEFLDIILDSVRIDKPNIYPYVLQLVDTLQNYAHTYGPSGIPYIMEQYGHEKRHFYPIIDEEEGLIKMYRFGTAHIKVDEPFVQEVAGHFIREYILSYYNKEGHLPPIRWNDDLHPSIKAIYIQGKINSKHDCLKIPPKYWLEIIFANHRKFEYCEDALDLLDDKAITPHLDHVNQLFAYDVLYVLSQRPPKDRETTRLVLKILSEPEIDIRKFYEVVEKLGYIPPNWSIIQLLPKERELKIDARMFSILVYEIRMMCSVAERNIATGILPLFTQQTITDSGPALKSKVDFLTTLKEDKDYIWVSFNSDLEQWNYTFRQSLQIYFTNILNQIYGVKHFFTVTKIFLESWITGANKFIHWDISNIFCNWENHLGGNQGIFQKLWTLITFIYLDLVLSNSSYQFHIIGSGDNQNIFVRFKKGMGLKDDIVNLREQLSEGFSKLGLTLKKEETWYSSSLFAYQRKFYYKGQQCENGIKQVIRGYSGGSDVACGMSDLVMTAMNAGMNISETTCSPLVGPVFSYLEALSILSLYPPDKKGFFQNEYNLLLCTFLTTDFGYLPFMQLTGFLFSGHKDTLTDSFALVKRIWNTNPELQSIIAVFMQWRRCSDSVSAFSSLVENPLALYLDTPPSYLSIIRSRVEDYLQNPLNVKNIYIQSLIKASTGQHKQEFINHLTPIRPINTSLLNMLLETSHIGQVAGMVNRFNRITSLVSTVNMNRVEEGNSSFQDIIVNQDSIYINHLARRINVRRQAQTTWWETIVFPYIEEYTAFCTQHQYHLDCSFSVRLFLTSFTHHVYPETVSGPYTPSPIEQTNVSLNIDPRLIDRSIILSPAYNIPDNSWLTNSTRGPFGLLIGSKTENPVKTIRLSSISGVELGKSIRELLKLYAWLKDVTDDERLLKLVQEQLGIKAPVIRESIDLIVGGTSGGTFEHRFEALGIVTGAFLSSASLQSTWIRLSTNKASTLQRGEEDRYIFFQAIFQHVIAGTRFCNLNPEQWMISIPLDHCSYLVPKTKFTYTDYVEYTPEQLIKEFQLSSSILESIREELQHTLAIRQLFVTNHGTPAQLLASYIGFTFASLLKTHVLGKTEVADRTGRGLAPQSTYNISILRKISLTDILLSCCLHSLYFRVFNNSNHPVRAFNFVKSCLGKPSTIQNVGPYKQLIDAIITSGKLEELAHIAKIGVKWVEGNIELSSLYLLLEGLLWGFQNLLMIETPPVLLIETKRACFSWAPVLSLFSKINSDFRFWLLANPQASFSTALFKYLDCNPKIFYHVTLERGLVLQKARQAYEDWANISGYQPITDFTSVIRRSPAITIPSPLYLPFITSLSPAQSNYHISTLQRSIHNHPLISFTSLQYIGRWGSISSGARSKLAEILSTFPPLTNNPSGIICLAEGTGSYLSLLLHQYEFSFGFYNSLLPPEQLSHGFASHFIPPECICKCGITNRMMVLPTTTTTYGDLTNNITWDHMIEAIYSKDLTIDILTMDLDPFTGGRSVVFFELVKFLREVHPNYCIIKLFISDFKEPMDKSLKEIFDLYDNLYLHKPSASEILSPEIFLICFGVPNSSSLNQLPPMTDLCYQWSKILSGLTLKSYFLSHIEQARAWRKSSYCPQIYPSTLQSTINDSHPIVNTLHRIIYSLYHLAVSPLILKAHIDKPTMHMLESQSRGAVSTYEDYYSQLIVINWYLLAIKFVGDNLTIQERDHNLKNIPHDDLLTLIKSLEAVDHDLPVNLGFKLLGEIVSTGLLLDGSVVSMYIILLGNIFHSMPSSWRLRSLGNVMHPIFFTPLSPTLLQCMSSWSGILFTQIGKRNINIISSIIYNHFQEMEVGCISYPNYLKYYLSVAGDLFPTIVSHTPRLVIIDSLYYSILDVIPESTQLILGINVSEEQAFGSDFEIVKSIKGNSQLNIPTLTLYSHIDIIEF
ncbi:RNA-dependent RNA polymerase [Hubei rhabdo-like virus 5]|uniref:Replicase n=1 Tax=Hubei rhabdo-like virus 5 TaxID=1923189 RepID=A0A1L3KN65_9MONO|nr:RNA-dependent RNA polymerase [Hubei rhabdo-like virus 5]APG78806.1 RNA-dependent RNA polymerase [Hubei rhabdo-like virus 5]